MVKKNLRLEKDCWLMQSFCCWDCLTRALAMVHVPIPLALAGHGLRTRDKMKTAGQANEFCGPSTRL